MVLDGLTNCKKKAVVFFLAHDSKWVITYGWATNSINVITKPNLIGNGGLLTLCCFVANTVASDQSSPNNN